MATSSDFYNDEVSVGEGALKNLTISLPKHLRRLDRDKSRIIYFIETRWIPQRNKTIKQIQKICKKLKEEKKSSNEMQIIFKSIGMGGKVAMSGGIAYPPAALIGGVVALTADGISSVLSIVAALKTDDLLEKTAALLKDDENVTNQLKKLLNNFNLVLQDLEADVKKFHASTKSGLFHKLPRCSDKMEKFINRTRCIDKITPTTMFRLLEDFFSVMNDPKTREEMATCFSDFCDLNPDIANGVRSLRIVPVNAGAIAVGLSELSGLSATVLRSCVAFVNLFAVYQDASQISSMVCELKGGCDTKATIHLDDLLDVLQKEADRVKKGITRAN